jgi:hypothetical protein
MSLVGFPLLLIPLAIFNIIVFLMPGVSFGATLASLPLMSGAVWKATLGDALLALGLVLLMFEVIKASRPNGRYLTDHLLSFLTLAATVAEFLLLPPFATSVFLLLAVMMAVDFIVGVSLRLRREAIGRTPVRVKSESVARPVPPTEPVLVPPMLVPAAEAAAPPPEATALAVAPSPVAAALPAAHEPPSVVVGRPSHEAPASPAPAAVPDASVR